MKSRKKGIAIAVVSGGLLLVAGLIAIAYFMDNNNRNNTVKPAENVLEISEDYKPPPEQTLNDNIYKKEIRIVNNGNAPCYIRVYADFSDSSVRSRSYLSNDWDEVTNAGNFYKAERNLTDSETYAANLGTAAPEWDFVSDDDTTPLAGYYYYKERVAPGASTEPLFTYVKTRNTSDEEIQQYDILVYSESVQITGMDGRVYNDYRDAWQDKLK